MCWRADDHLKEAGDHVDVGAGGGHKHAQCQAGVHILQMLLRGLRSATQSAVNRLNANTPQGKRWSACTELTYIWEKVNRASMLMLRSNTFMVEAGGRRFLKSRLNRNTHSASESTLSHNMHIHNRCHIYEPTTFCTRGPVSLIKHRAGVKVQDTVNIKSNQLTNNNGGGK